MDVTELLNKLVVSGNIEVIVMRLPKGPFPASHRYRQLERLNPFGEQRLPRFKKGALEAYSRAMELCRRGPLKPYNAVCLGLALNFSVFHYEVMGDPVRACEIAKQTLEEAIEVIDECSEEHF